MDTVLRVLFFLLVGTALLIMNVWFVLTFAHAVFNRSVIIAPFRVTGAGSDGKQLGSSLAQMLQSRLAHLTRRLENAQRWLEAPELAEGVDERGAFLFEPIKMPTAVFDPVDVEIKVGGVEVGGVFSWLQAAIVKPRTLAFYVHLATGKEESAAQTAIVTSSLAPFAASKQRGLWVETTSDPDEIATMIAYALIQRRLAASGTAAVQALEITEFRDLLDAIFELADVNRRVAAGRATGADFEALLPRLQAHLEKIPDWHELRYLTARVAESTGQVEAALQSYRWIDSAAKVGKGIKEPKQELAATAAERVQQFASEVRSTRSPEQQGFVTRAVAYARKLDLPGPEPEIGFVEHEFAGALAIWQNERYEVDPRSINYPGLDRYVALMGRFLSKHYHCLSGSTQVSIELWQELRSSLVEYVIATDEDTPGRSDHRAYGMRLFKVLNDLQQLSDVVVVRKLVLGVLDRFDCDWTDNNLTQKFDAVNQALAIGIAPGLIEQAFARRP